MTRTEWTEERVAWLRSYAPGHSIHQIADEFERLWGYRPSVSTLKNAKVKYNAPSGTNGGQFRKGHAGGFTSEEHKRKFLEAGKATRFKKGQMPHNGHQPIGTERMDRDGYVWVKIAKRKTNPKSAHDNWIEKHRLVYMEHHGEIPEGHVVVFADRDRSNFDPDNLVAVPRGVVTIIAHRGLQYHDRETLEACIMVAMLDHARYKAECRPRPCRECGAMFTARYPHQKRCDDCIKRRR